MKRLLVLAVLALATAACEAPPDALFQAVALGEVARAQAEAGNATGAERSAALALDAAESVTKQCYRFEALGTAAVAQVRTGDDARAHAVAESLADPDDRAKAFVLLALALADMGDQLGALAAANHALDLATSVAKTPEQDLIHAMAVRAQVEAGDLAGALDTLEGIADTEVRAGAMAQVVEVQIETGDLTAAFGTAQAIPNVHDEDEINVLVALLRGIAVGVHRTLDALILGDDMPPRARALALVALAQAEAGQKDAAGQSFALALESARAIERSSKRRESLEAIALAQARTGDAAAALRTLREATDSDDPAKTLPLVAIAEAARGDPLAALETLRGLPADGDRVESLSRVALAAVASGRVWAAEDALDLALEAAADSDEAGMDPGFVWILSRVAATQAEAGDQAGARQTAATALDMLRATAGRGDRGFVFLLVAAAQAEAGDIEGALATAQQIADPY
jgi:tetratricopeptide (TPR) repeat protein